jgi:hypothetical protein
MGKDAWRSPPRMQGGSVGLPISHCTDHASGLLLARYKAREWPRQRGLGGFLVTPHNNSGPSVVISGGPTAHVIGPRAIRNEVQLRGR